MLKNKGYRINISLDGDIADLFLSKKAQMPHGFKKLFVQKLTDDFIASSGKKELKKNIVKYISGEIKLKFIDDRPQISENSGNIQDGKLNELMKLKNNF